MLAYCWVNVVDDGPIFNQRLGQYLQFTTGIIKVKHHIWCYKPNVISILFHTKFSKIRNQG